MTMGKILLYSIIAFLSISCNIGRSDLNNDLGSANLKGKVMHIDGTFHDADVKCACPAAQKCACNQESFNYDEHGNFQEFSKVDNRCSITGYLLSISLEYFKHGNWVGQAQLYNGEIQNITIRNITYYNS
jgi:hypothetical protein